MQDVDLLFATEMAFFLVLFCFFSESGFILIICTVCFRGKTTLSKRKYHRNLV